MLEKNSYDPEGSLTESCALLILVFPKRLDSFNIFQTFQGREHFAALSSLIMFIG